MSDVELDMPTTLHTAQTLMQAVFTGYGGNFTTIAYDTPDYDKLMHLERNVYQFSGAKNWQMLKELTKALVSVSPAEPGKQTILSFREFKNKAITILDEYNGRNLKTEYNAAIAGAQMASKWVDFEKAAGSSPSGAGGVLLEYRTQGDGRVREDHKVLDRITRPVDDNFWKTYYPPNGWNCRCTVIRLNEGKASSDKTTNRAMADVTPQKGFTTNLAKEGFVFPKNSAYYIGCPQSVLRQALELLPQERLQLAFETLFIPETGKGSVTRHLKAETTKSDYPLLESIAKEKATTGHNVEILPEINRKEIELREKVLPGAKEGKNPDLRINGVYVEVKGIKSDKIRAVKTNISRAGNQANHAIIGMTQKFDETKIKKLVKQKFNDKPDLLSIELRYDGVYVRYNREDFVK